MFHLVRDAIVKMLIARGADPGAATSTVAGIGNGEILQWLLAHGGDIVKLVETILTILAVVPKTSTPPAA